MDLVLSITVRPTENTVARLNKTLTILKSKTSFLRGKKLTNLKASRIESDELRWTPSVSEFYRSTGIPDHRLPPVLQRIRVSPEHDTRTAHLKLKITNRWFKSKPDKHS